MKLIGYEYLKWFRKRLLVVLIPLLLIGNGYLYVKDQYNKNGYLIDNIDAYNSAEKEYARMRIDQGYERIKRMNMELQRYQMIVMAAQNPDTPSSAEDLARIKQQSPNIMEAFKSSGYSENLDKLRQDTYISELLLKQYEAMRGYKEYSNGIRKRADELLTVSIFQDEHSFSYRNIVKTPQDFASLEDLPLQLGREWGVVSATTFSITDALMISLIFLLCIYLFQYEKDSSLVKLTRSTARGRFPLVTSKVAALISMSVILSVFFYGSLLLLAYNLYDFGDLSRYVQSMEAFRYCNLPLTVGQYLVLYLICKVIVTILAALAISFLFILLGNIFSVYAGLFAFLAVEYLSFRYLHPLSPLQFFKYINLFSFYDAYGLLAIYRNLNLGGYPVWYPQIAGVSAVVLLLLLSAAGIMCYTYRYPTATPSRIFSWIAQQLLKLRKPPASVRLFRHEWYKFMFAGKVYLVLAAALWIGYQDLNMQELRFNEEDAIYNGYMRVLTGSLDQSKINYIVKEQRRFAELPLQYDRMLKQYQEGKLSPAQYLKQKGELDLFSLKEKAFSRVYTQYLHLVEQKETRGINGSFLNELSTNYLFRNHYRDLVNGLTYTILLMLSLSVVFPADYRNGMAAILRSTRRGRLPLFAVKHAIAGIAALTLMLILYSPAVYNSIASYPSIDWEAPVQSIRVYGHLKDALTVGEFACGVFGLQILGAMLVSVCTLYLSILMQKRAPGLLLASTVFVIPFLIQLAGFEEIRSYTFTGFFTLFGAFAQMDSLLSIGGYTGLLIGLSAIACFKAWLLYTNPESLGVRLKCYFRSMPSAKAIIKGKTKL
ncbi:hypothetical protein [Paenibacillus sp. GCM10027626]|uniref:hypothetical protein n=1 Tax=Paenibacillus sp. GCM10027626 TaxID=3273411 RepID=UPI003637B99A